jgi:hypothetical protein
MGGRKPIYLTSSTSVLTSVKAISVVPSGGNKMDVHRENTDVRWVGFHPLPKNTIASYSYSNKKLYIAGHRPWKREEAKSLLSF